MRGWMPERFDLTKSVARLLSDRTEWHDNRIIPALVEEYEISPARVGHQEPGTRSSAIKPPIWQAG
jgi:hypothetical protein